jgi:hypothetical protein
MLPYNFCGTDYAHSRIFSSTLLPRQRKKAATIQENGLTKNPYLITPGFGIEQNYPVNLVNPVYNSLQQS